MNKNLKSLILTAAVCLALVACDSQAKRMEQAKVLYEEGMQLREQRRSEEAAEKFLQGLSLVQRSDKTAETVPSVPCTSNTAFSRMLSSNINWH